MRALLCLIASACIAPDAGAVFTQMSTTGNYGITLQVGSADAIDEVVFDVSGPNVGTSTAVARTGAPGTAGVTIVVKPNRPSMLFTETRPVTLTVDSSIALGCVTPATCGGTTIPFNTIRWTSTDSVNPTANQFDIQSGSFNGGGAQPLAGFNAAIPGFLGFFNGDTRFMTNTITFEYTNSTVYPAGRYRGTVRFTATMV